MTRRFLFLQGPHGPFFRQLARHLRIAGAEVHRVGFNAGDAAFWGRSPGYIAHRAALEDWPEALAGHLDALRITDIVLYGDTRPVHAEAVRQATARGLTVHVFEEGYLRPYWVTYERGGSNGHSRLMDLSLAEIRARQAEPGGEMPVPPAQWGDMAEHIFYGAAYHWCVMFANGGYPNFRSHRRRPLRTEARAYFRRLAGMPFHAARRAWRTRQVKASGRPYHIALLQLEHDASFQAHSPFETGREFLEDVIAGFARGAPKHHLLVLKAHPLDATSAETSRAGAEIAKRHGVADRVIYVRGGKLAQLLADAESAVTVNSTAGQQALWRGIPLKAFGTAVYDKPEFCSDQPTEAFFAAPRMPDVEGYRCFRQFLLETSQLPGGFYSRKGRRQLLRRVTDRMLSPRDPYDRQSTAADAPSEEAALAPSASLP